LDSLKQSVQDDKSLPEALQLSAQAAKEGMLGTIPLVARKGRASYLGERSAGHQDPGATSSYLVLKTAAETWADS
jgi:dihydroxyacetone kinase-like protein